MDRITDLSLFGCYRVTDSGILHVAHLGLRRVNVCGCYKVLQVSRLPAPFTHSLIRLSVCQVTDMGRRFLISQNPRILTYNRAADFGLAAPNTVYHKKE